VEASITVGVYKVNQYDLMIFPNPANENILFNTPEISFFRFSAVQESKYYETKLTAAR
jgi:hypothetical protein